MGIPAGVVVADDPIAAPSLDMMMIDDDDDDR